MNVSSRLVRLASAAVLLCAGAAAADEALHLELRNGSKIDGRIAGADDASITFRPAVGGEIRIAWKDLQATSWLAAKKAIVDPADGAALFELAQFAADNAMRLDAEAFLAGALKADGKLKPAIDALAPRLAELRHAEAVALFERGQGFMEKGNWYQALGRFQEARKLEPGYAAAVNGVGEAYFQLRKLKDSRQWIDEAIRIDPTCKDALFNRAYLALLELDFRSCLTGLEEVTALAPADGRFGTREEALDAGKKAGLAKAEDAMRKFGDSALIQARDLAPVMREVVRGPGFAKEFVASSEHYDLHTDVSQEYAETIAARMELVYAEYERRFGYDKTGEQKTRGKKLRFPVIVFQDKEEYVAWFTRVLRNPLMAQATGGVYVPLVKHLVFFQNKTFEDTQLVAWHEGFHQYLDYFVGDVPLWFNEGQAEYFGGSRLDKTGRKLFVGQTEPWRVPALNDLLVRNHLQPAQWLMRCPQPEFMRLEEPKAGETTDATWTAGFNYAAAWGLVHYCMEGDGRRWAKHLLAYFKSLCDGATPEEAFEKAWGRVDWTSFNEGFRAHCDWLVKRAVAERDGREPPPMPK
jgi:tetratricopeptide (TPR) repeat protein